MPDSVYVLVVHGEVKEDMLDEFLAGFAILAAHVQAHEGGCLTYQLSLGEEAKNKIMIFERYVSHDYLDKVHRESEPYKTFIAKAADYFAAQPTMLSYLECDSKLGFMSR